MRESRSAAKMPTWLTLADDRLGAYGHITRRKLKTRCGGSRLFMSACRTAARAAWTRRQCPRHGKELRQCRRAAYAVTLSGVLPPWRAACAPLRECGNGAIAKAGHTRGLQRPLRGRYFGDFGAFTHTLTTAGTQQTPSPRPI
jgi:hypothetical protein